MSDLEFVTVVLSKESDGLDEFPRIGVPEMRWKGEPLTFPTTGDYTLEFGSNSMATLTVHIPVLIEVEPSA